MIPSDQAHALRISIDLYKKIVAIRKEYANDLPIDNRINPVVIVSWINDWNKIHSENVHT